MKSFLIFLAAEIIRLLFLVFPIVAAGLVYYPTERQVIMERQRLMDQPRDADWGRRLEEQFRCERPRLRRAGWLAGAAFLLAALFVTFVEMNWHAIGREISRQTGD